jgi:3-oxoadipate enol-lactonase
MQRNAFEVQLAAGADVRQDPGPQIDLTALDMPVLIVSGAHDLDFFRDVAEHLAERIPQARHVALSWAWHLPNLQRPETVTELLRAFL